MIQPEKGTSQGSTASRTLLQHCGSTIKAGTARQAGWARSRSYQPPPLPKRMPSLLQARAGTSNRPSCSGARAMPPGAGIPQ